MRVPWLAAFAVLVLAALAAAAPPSDALFQPFRVHPADANNQRQAHASGDLLVWGDDRDWPGGTAQEHEIYAYNFTTGQTQRLTHHPSSKTFPHTSQGWVVWADDRDGATHLWAWDPATQQERRITWADAAQTSPDIDAPWVVYKQATGEQGTFEIYAHNLDANETRLLSPSPGLLLNPSVGGRLVAWTEIQNVEVSGVVESNIRAVDLTTGESRVVVTVDGEQSAPDVDDPFIVWQDSRACDGCAGWELYSYHWDTRAERALVRAPKDQTFVQIAWPNLVWRDTRHLGEDQDAGHSVYWQDLSTAAPARRITDATHNVQNELALGDRFVGWVELRSGGGGGAFDVWAARLVEKTVTATPTLSPGQDLTVHPVDAPREDAAGAGALGAVAAAVIAMAALRRR